MIIKLLKYPFYFLFGIPILLVSFLLTKTTKYVYISEFLSRIPFRFGEVVRYFFYKNTLAECGQNVIFNYGCIIANSNSIIGSNIRIGVNCIVGNVHLKDNVIIGQNCHFLSGKNQHHFSRTDIPIREQGGKPLQIAIGPDVYFGASCSVMANINKGCVIGAGSVVNKEIPSYSVAVGNPCRVIKSRKGNNE
ncbi:MAG: hypothetical protein PWQ06_2512 [Anaerophaga sp.]|nr:hypothetical protein [Anaerophaga sp.]